MIFIDKPHRRYNPLKDEWILVSPHRMARPWQGHVEKSENYSTPAYDPRCYLCPGNKRAGGKQNPHYTDTFVFTNDFSALLPEKDTPRIFTQNPLLKSELVGGICRVLCFSPRHDLSLASMAISDIRKVIDAWSDQVTELERDYGWVQVFENKGLLMGCSNPHPHGQIWASNTWPNEIMKEDQMQKHYRHIHGSPLLLDYVELELKERERVVVENELWMAVVPFWASWPYETLLMPKFAVTRLPDLNHVERDALAELMKPLLQKYDALFQVSFPYSMGWHAAPVTSENQGEHWQLHAHFYPPLLRSATVRKFMVGYEMLAEPQRDITPEVAAEILRQKN